MRSLAWSARAWCGEPSRSCLCNYSSSRPQSLNAASSRPSSTSAVKVDEVLAFFRNRLAVACRAAARTAARRTRARSRQTLRVPFLRNESVRDDGRALVEHATHARLCHPHPSLVGKEATWHRRFSRRSSPRQDQSPFVPLICLGAYGTTRRPPIGATKSSTSCCPIVSATAA